jgi:IS5 family transposase
MDDFTDYFLRQEYTKIAHLGNKLGEIRDIIDWEQFRPIVRNMYHDNKETGGRPHTDEILMIKMLVLAAWYNLSA